jgi:hypothetical protein
MYIMGTAGSSQDIFAPWDPEVGFVDMADLAKVQQSHQPNTKLIWV